MAVPLLLIVVLLECKSLEGVNPGFVLNALAS